MYVQFTFKRMNENIRKMVTEVKESVAGKAQVRNISQSLGRLAKVSHTHTWDGESGTYKSVAS